MDGHLQHDLAWRIVAGCAHADRTTVGIQIATLGVGEQSAGVTAHDRFQASRLHHCGRSFQQHGVFTEEKLRSVIVYTSDVQDTSVTNTVADSRRMAHWGSLCAKVETGPRSTSRTFGLNGKIPRTRILLRPRDAQNRGAWFGIWPMLIRFRLKCRSSWGCCSLPTEMCFSIMSFIAWFPSAPQTTSISSNSIFPLAETPLILLIA